MGVSRVSSALGMFPRRIGAGFLVVLVTLVTFMPAHGQLPQTLQWIEDNKGEIAENLTVPINNCVRRTDTSHPVFHGCIDWHSSVHGVWAIVAYTGATGDKRYVETIEATLDRSLLEQELSDIRANPRFEIPYGRAWFLKLVIDYERIIGDDRLKPLGDHVAVSIKDYYSNTAFDPNLGEYDNPSWALINLLEYAKHRNDKVLSSFVGDVVRKYIDANKEECAIAREGQGFMAICTNLAWLVSKVLPKSEFEMWLDGYLPDMSAIAPVSDPKTSHHNGLNFSRAWGLWHIYQVTKDKRYADLYAQHFLTAYRNRKSWDGDYRRVSHWVAQFGMYALVPVFNAELETTSLEP